MLQGVFFAYPDLKPWEERLPGRKVVDVRPRGKALLIRFDIGVTMYSHLLLYGRWYIRRTGEMPDTRRQLRVALQAREWSALLYSASEISMLHDEDMARHPYLGRLGPDPLDTTTRPSMLCDRLEEPRFARRSLGALLLDQSFLSGIGNYLRSEILYYAGLPPTPRPADLAPETRLRLARSVITISRRAYRLGGATRTPHLVRRLRVAGRPPSEYRYWVYGRAGEACHRCGGVVIKRTVSGRGLYRCDSCQA